MSKLSNEYVRVIPVALYEDTPKAVFAAIAVSFASQGGDYLEHAETNVLREWWALYRNRIVPQKPAQPEPEERERRAK